MIAMGAIMSDACDEKTGDANLGKPSHFAVATGPKSIGVPRPRAFVAIAYST